MLKAVNDNVFIKLDSQERISKSGIIFSDNTKIPRAISGTVISAGKGIHTKKGFEPSQVQEGDRVAFKKYEFTNLDKETVFGKEKDIIAKLEGDIEVKATRLEDL